MFPLNPIAAEFGANYDVLVTVSSADQKIEDQIAEAVSHKYECLRR